jgi:hypothetical protein
VYREQATFHTDQYRLPDSNHEILYARPAAQAAAVDGVPSVHALPPS